MLFLLELHATHKIALEFQNSISGLFFVAGFFNSQPSLVTKFTLN